MAKEYKASRDRKIGKQVVQKKPLIDKKTRSKIWTVVIVLTLVVFFIINNTRNEPEEGPYPPNYNPSGNNIGN